MEFKDETNKDKSATVAIIDERAINEIKEIAARGFNSWTRAHNGAPFCPMTNWTEALRSYLVSRGVSPSYTVKGLRK